MKKNPAETIGRNQPCPCGSGRNYKKCCGAKTASGSTGEKEVDAEPPGPDGAADQRTVPTADRVDVIDRRVMDAIVEPLGATMAEIGSELGLSVAVRSASYSDVNAKIELEVATVRDDGVVMDKEAVQFLRRCLDFGFERDDLGRTFVCGGETFRIAGLLT